jgi:hypothetical protein
LKVVWLFCFVCWLLVRLPVDGEVLEAENIDSWNSGFGLGFGLEAGVVSASLPKEIELLPPGGAWGA